MGYFDASHSSLVNMQKVAIKLGLVSEGHFRIPAKSDDEAPTTEMSMLDGLAAEEVMINDAEVNNVQQEVEAAEEEAVKEESAEAAAIPGLLLTKQRRRRRLPRLPPLASRALTWRAPRSTYSARLPPRPLRRTAPAHGS